MLDNLITIAVGLLTARCYANIIDLHKYLTRVI